MGVRDEHRARMLLEIQRAALDLVEENGLDATTVADIAARVGISERTVFRYYSSKIHALMPGQQGLIDALVTVESPRSDPAGILHDLLAASREVFAHEVERRVFRRVSRLLMREPDLLHAVAQQERVLVETLRTALTERGALPHLQAHLVAEVVTAAWRVAWQSFDREELEGRDRDPLSLFDETVRELGGLFPG
ncbi:TetR/AcrR family transcriptional regulator [Dietzia kunjamensis]|uniref:TetR/AcrR family transcriptional regulator n=1 Tax=Dietzia kunjamensis TaxID=322509 RepID=UPI002DBD823E|nr:helix-turn-helix domain-containing protein [Dietzia kunjamensis]MEB8327162.1 TetR/AcrR family transcriptional regulator [Dietzia kunjamensis]